MSKLHRRLTPNKRRWEAVRHVVFERDGYRCTSCGRAGRLECDHITPLEQEPGQDAYDPNGLQTLCVDCHRRKSLAERPDYDPALEEQREAWRRLVLEIAAE